MGGVGGRGARSASSRFKEFSVGGRRRSPISSSAGSRFPLNPEPLADRQAAGAGRPHRAAATQRPSTQGSKGFEMQNHNPTTHERYLHAVRNVVIAHAPAGPSGGPNRPETTGKASKHSRARRPIGAGQRQSPDQHGTDQQAPRLISGFGVRSRCPANRRSTGSHDGAYPSTRTPRS